MSVFCKMMHTKIPVKSTALAALFCSGLLWPACKKDDKKSPAKTNFEMLSASSWKIDTIGFDMDRNGTIDAEIPGGLAACQHDNTFAFLTDGTGTYDEGPLKCDDSDPQSLSFNWYLAADNKVLNLSGNLPEELTGDFTIISLSETALMVYKQVSIESSAPVTANLIVALKK